MPDLDVDRAREFGVAVPPASADEYAEQANQLQPGHLATADGSDPSVGWTSQHRDAGRENDEGKTVFSNFVEPLNNLPGQVYLPEQLPDPQAAITAGLPPVKIPAHLITDDVDHIQGPEPSESAIADRRAALRLAVVSQAESVVPDATFDGPPAIDTTEAPSSGSLPDANPPAPKSAPAVASATPPASAP